MGTMNMFPSLLLYLAVYSLSALLLSFATGSRNKGRSFLLAAVAIALPCILAGWRYGVGVDYFNYLSLYNSHSKLTLLQYLSHDRKCEFAFYLISRFAGLFKSPQLFFALFAFFAYAPMAKVIMDRGDRKETFFLSFFFLISSFSTGLNIIRQIAAASITFFSLKYVSAACFFLSSHPT